MEVYQWSPSSLPDAQTAGVKRQLARLTSWGGENIYLARDAGLVTAKRAGHRTPAEKALGLQMSGDSILAKWGQPHAPVSCPAWPAAVPVACLWFANWLCLLLYLLLLPVALPIAALPVALLTTLTIGLPAALPAALPITFASCSAL